MLFYWGRNFLKGECEKDRRMENDQQEQFCLELIAELKLAQDGVFKIHVAFKRTCTLIQKS